MKRWVLLGVAALMAACAISPFARASFPGRNGELAIGGPHGIWVAKRAGETPARVSMRGIEPSFSADGSMLTYAAPRPGNGGALHDEIFVADADGSHVQRLTHNFEIDTEPTFSPDGRKIVFVRDVQRSGTFRLFIMRSDGSHQHALPTEAGKRADTYAPSYSPDGHHLAFTQRFHLVVMLMGRSHRERNVAHGSTPKLGTAIQPDWSPDGRWLVFAGANRERSNALGVFTVPFRGGKVRTLASFSRRGHHLVSGPVFSPDGQKVAFIEGHRLRIVNADGSRLRHVSGIPRRQFSVSWGSR